MLNIYCQMLMSILVVNSQSMGLGGGFIMTIYLENGTRYSIYLLVPWYSTYSYQVQYLLAEHGTGRWLHHDYLYLKNGTRYCRVGVVSKEVWWSIVVSVTASRPPVSCSNLGPVASL